MSGELTFAAGETEKWVEVALVDDTVEDGGETFGLRLTSVTGAVLGDAEGVGTILNTEALNVEAPAFAESGYVFELAENADGSALPVALGAVSATDPEGSAVGYSIVGGNDAGLFAIDASTGALIYVGSGEDYESGTRSHALTVRASDGTLHSDVAVTVNLTDVVEAPSDPDSVRGGAATLLLGSGSAFVTGSVDGIGDVVDYYRFTLAETKQVTVDLFGMAGGNFDLHRDADLLLQDAEGNELARSSTEGRGGELLQHMLLSEGTYYLAVLAQETGNNPYYLSVNSADPSQVSVSDAVGHESPAAHETNGGTVRFRVSLDQAAPSAVTVRYETVDGTALAGEDYEATSGGLEFAAGESEKWVEVTLIDDMVEDGGKTFSLQLSGVTGAVLRDARGVGTILDDESVSVSEPAWMDFPGDPGTPGRVLVGESVTGTFEAAGDVDWFAVEFEAGKSYRIDRVGNNNHPPTTDVDEPGWWQVHLPGIYGADGNLVRSGAVVTEIGLVANDRIAFTAVAGGTHYVSISAFERWQGTYALSVTEFADDFADHTGTTGAVSVGGSATGEIDTADDVDWFAVTLEAGRTYRIDLKGRSTGDGTVYDPHLRGVHDADGALIAGTLDANDGAGWNSRLDLSVQKTGTYYLAASTKHYWYHWTGTYEVSVTDVTHGRPDDFAAGTDTTGAVAVGGSVTGEIEVSPDVDWFAVSLEAGTSYRIDLEGSATGAGTLGNPYVKGIYTSNGNFIDGTRRDNNDHWDSNKGVWFTPTETGTYYVAAGNAAWDNEGTYRLSVRALAGDIAADTGTTGTVEVGGSVTGTAEFSADRDWFAVTLEAGRTYRIDLEGVDTNVGSLWDPYLHGLYDSSGILIEGTTHDNGGVVQNSRVDFMAAVTGTYYVAAGANSPGGTYRLSVRDITGGIPDDYSATTETTGTVAVNRLAWGEIETFGDVDWFAATLVAGRTYQFDLLGSPTTPGALFDPYLHGIHDAGGTLIEGTSDDDGGPGKYSFDSRVWFTPTETGTYYVAAGGVRTAEGAYRLHVADITDRERAPDDFPAGTGTTGAVSVGGSVMGDIENPYDHDWFAVTLEAGKTYRILLQGLASDAGDLRDTYLHGIHDQNGVLIAGTTNDNYFGLPDSRVIFSAPEAGTYYVAAGANGSQRGNYTLSVGELEDDFADRKHTTGEVEVGGSVTGEIEFEGDHDWFAVTLEAGKTYRIDLEGSPTERGALADTFLRGVRNADGEYQPDTRNDDYGGSENSRVTFTPTEGGTYYIDAASGSVYERGIYTLSVEEVDGI